MNNLYILRQVCERNIQHQVNMDMDRLEYVMLLNLPIILSSNSFLFYLLFSFLFSFILPLFHKLQQLVML